MKTQISFLVGVIVAATITYYSQQQRWQWLAWEHHAASFQAELRDMKPKLRFIWHDERPQLIMPIKKFESNPKILL